jgi:hypothetical protein
VLSADACGRLFSLTHQISSKGVTHMRWYAIQFTHYTGDDTMFENFEPDDYFPIDADTLSDPVSNGNELNGPNQCIFV